MRFLDEFSGVSWTAPAGSKSGNGTRDRCPKIFGMPAAGCAILVSFLDVLARMHVGQAIVTKELAHAGLFHLEILHGERLLY